MQRMGVEMLAGYFIVVYLILVVGLVVGVWRLTRRRGRRVTPGTALLASMDMLFDDTHRAAVEVIQEERTGERDPEDKDGNLPDLAPSRPVRASRGSATETSTYPRASASSSRLRRVTSFGGTWRSASSRRSASVLGSG